MPPRRASARLSAVQGAMAQEDNAAQTAANADVTVTGSGRSTRSSSARVRPEARPSPSPSATATATLAEGRGRPRKAPLVESRESPSSVPTPTNYASGSDYSTPLTSHAPTPAESSSKTSASITRRAGRIEVQLPARNVPKDSYRSLRKSVYAMGAKRKRTQIEDSEEDDALSDDSPDAQLAQRLQAEENAKVLDTPPTSSSNVAGRRRSARGPLASSSKKIKVDDEVDHLVEDSSDLGLLSASKSKSKSKSRNKGKGKAVIALPPAKKAVKGKFIRYRPEKDDDDDDEDDEDDDLSGVVVDDSDHDSDNDVDDDDDDYLSTATGRGKQVAAAPHRAKQRKSTSAARRALTTADSSALATPMDDSDIDGSTFSLSELDEAQFDGFDPSSEAREEEGIDNNGESEAVEEEEEEEEETAIRAIGRNRRAFRGYRNKKRQKTERDQLVARHPELKTMWKELEAMPVLKAGRADQPASISRRLKPFQLEGLAWMREMERTAWKGGLLGDEMGLGKTIQAVSLIMSDWPAEKPSLVLVPPVALMQWVSEIDSYTDGTLKTLVFHGTNSKTKGLKVKDLKNYHVIIMSYNSLESMYRRQEKGWRRKEGVYKEESIIHSTHFHRVILDEAHSIKTRTTMTAKSCFALKVDHRWCLTGTPLQNRIGEFFSLIRFLNIRPFASYVCKDCKCSTLEWSMNDDNKCSGCGHGGMRHLSIFNQELLNPIQKYGNRGPGAEAVRKLRLMTDRIMLRRLKKDHTNSMELPVKEIFVDRQFFGEAENDFANSIMTNGQRNFDTYVAQGVLLNNYANIFGLIMQMRQVADHPDLILKRNAVGGQNILVCCICDEPAEDAIRSACRHDFCRTCAKAYLNSSEQPDCPHCHIGLKIDLEQPEIEQDEALVKKSSIINRIKMENWTSSSKIELLVHELHRLRSDNATHKSIIFSQFTTMLQLVEWRLRRAGISTVMLDGSMTPAQRQASIEHFMKNVHVECFLVSLKAGGVALNLTEASRVFIVDPWWNPAAEWQSADRCHRIGQSRPCTITRLCIEDSVESRMVLLQEKKTNMINSTINSDDSAMESLSPEDLQFLFRGN